MIYRFPFLFLLFWGPTVPSAFAQNTLGFRIGLNVANVEGDLAFGSSYSSRVGFVAGLFLKLPLRSSFALQPEILYAQKGFRNDAFDLGSPEANDDVTAVLELTYLETPLLLKYEIPFGRTSLFGVYAGPTVEFELGEQRRLDSSELNVTEASDIFMSTGFGLAIGSDIEFSIGEFDVVTGARYTRGITDMLTETAAAVNRAPTSIYNSAFSFFVGLRL